MDVQALFFVVVLQALILSHGFQLENLRSPDLYKSIGQVEDLKTQIIPANFSEVYRYEINRTQQYLFIYKYTETSNETTAVRISSTSLKVDDNYPVMFVIRQERGLLSWQIPLSLNYIYKYTTVSRTLCPMDKNTRKTLSKDQLIYVDVSTMSVEPVNFTISASLISNFSLEHGLTKNVQVSPSEPVYFMYTFPDDVHSVLVTVHSQDTLCMIVSIQDIKCPVFDLNNNIVFQGKYQTMTKQAALILSKEDFDEEAFYLVMVVKSNDLDCSPIQSILPAERFKSVSVLIKGTISRYMYYKGIIAAVGVFLGFYLISFILIVVYHCSGYSKRDINIPDSTKEKLLGFVHQGSVNGYNAIPNNEDMLSRPCSELSHASSYGSIRSRTESDIPENNDEDISSLEDVDMLTDAYQDKRIVRTKTALFVSDLSRKKHKKLSKTYKIYFRNLLTIGIFYGLPVIQLVVNYQKVLHKTGDEDICYYNFYCAHPLGVLSSFNNVFSNIGYVLLGILFMLIVRRRETVHTSYVKENKVIAKIYGIPQHFGLYYAMGLSLIMEGIMSACYHVCPNNSNFQFDTSFMYIIACLNMIKIYQTRHPDVNAKSHTTYLSMAFIIFIAVIGVVYGTNIFWIIYGLVHMFISLVLSAQIYFMGMWNIDSGLLKRMWWLMRNDCFKCHRPVYPNRFILLLIGNIINWSFAIYGVVTTPTDFATYLLAIFIGNLMLYVMFYIIMKMLSGERIHLLSALCIIITIVMWIAALYFFFAHLTSWSVTPAKSREGNRECILLGFYDAHDIWHFLSAIGMFFGFLIILTLDDDLLLKRRDQIPVF